LRETFLADVSLDVVEINETHSGANQISRTFLIAPSSIQIISREAEPAELRRSAFAASKLAPHTNPFIDVGKVGGTGTFIPITNFIRNVVAQSTRDAVLGSGPVALVATGITPIASSVFVSVFVITALVDTPRLVKHEVGVTSKALKLRWTIAAFAVSEAGVAALSVRVKSNGTACHALRLLFVVEGKKIVVGDTSEALVEAETGGTFGIAFTTCAALRMREEPTGT